VWIYGFNGPRLTARLMFVWSIGSCDSWWSVTAMNPTITRPRSPGSEVSGTIARQVFHYLYSEQVGPIGEGLWFVSRSNEDMNSSRRGPAPRPPALSIALTCVAFAVVLAACGSSGTTDGAGIAVQDPGLVATGSVLYQANCAECHGADLRGTDKGPPHLSIVYEPNHHGDAAFLLAAQQGVRAHHWRFGDMAAVEGLSSGDVAAIVAFVRENQRVEGFEPYPP